MTGSVRTAALITALLWHFPSEGLALPLVGNISVGLGVKWTDPLLNSTHTGGVREPIVNIIVGHRSLPVMLEGYASGTRQEGEPDTDDNVLLRETRTEVGLGVTGVRRIGPLYSHLGGGIARVTSRLKSLYPESPEGSFTRTGHWIGGGAFLPLVAGFSVGAGLRYAKVDADHNFDLGGWSANALIGWGWSSSR